MINNKISEVVERYCDKNFYIEALAISKLENNLELYKHTL
jgi:hypothetical protein